MFGILLKLIEEKVSPSACKERISKMLINLMSDPLFLENRKAELKAKKLKFLHDKLLRIVDELEKIRR